MPKAVKYGFGAIALYIMVAFTGGSKLVSSGSSGLSSVVKTFQGR